MTITIRGVAYPTSKHVAMQAIPLFSAIGVDISNTKPINNKAFAENALERLSEPSNWHKIAYSLKSLVRGIPDEIVSYECRVYPDGSKTEVGYIDLSTEELVEAIAAIMDALPQESAPKKPRPQHRRGA